MDVDTRKPIAVVDKILTLANETGLGNVNAQDIDELLQVTTGERNSNDDLKEIVEQQLRADYEISVSENEEQKKLASSKAKRSVIDAMSCDEQLLAVRNRKMKRRR